MPDEGPLFLGRSSDGKWRCSAYLSLTQQNEFVMYRLDVRPWGRDLIPLGTDVLRRLPLGRWLTSAHSWLRAPMEEWLDSGAVTTSRPIEEKELRRLRQQAERLVKSELPEERTQRLRPFLLSTDRAFVLRIAGAWCGARHPTSYC